METDEISSGFWLRGAELLVKASDERPGEMRLLEMFYFICFAHIVT